MIGELAVRGTFPARCRGDTRRHRRRPVARHDWPRLDAGAIVRPRRGRRRGHQGASGGKGVCQNWRALFFVDSVRKK